MIEKADQSQIDEIVTLINASYWEQQKKYFIDIPLSRERITVQKLTDIFADGSKKILVLKCYSNNIQGVMVVGFPPTKTYAKFELFAIDPACVGQKLGSKLIAFAENLAVSQGRTLMKIEVFIFADGLANYYVKNGYRFTGKCLPFFHEGCIKPEYQNASKLYLQELVKDIL